MKNLITEARIASDLAAAAKSFAITTQAISGGAAVGIALLGVPTILEDDQAQFVTNFTHDDNGEFYERNASNDELISYLESFFESMKYFHTVQTEGSHRNEFQQIMANTIVDFKSNGIPCPEVQL